MNPVRPTLRLVSTAAVAAALPHEWTLSLLVTKMSWRGIPESLTALCIARA